MKNSAFYFYIQESLKNYTKKEEKNKK